MIRHCICIAEVCDISEDWAVVAKVRELGLLRELVVLGRKNAVPADRFERFPQAADPRKQIDKIEVGLVDSGHNCPPRVWLVARLSWRADDSNLSRHR